MNYRVFLAIGNDEIESKISGFNNVNIVDSESNLETLKDLLKYIDVDYLILNRLLDDDGKSLIDVASIAKSKNVKVIVLMHDLESFNEKKLIGALVSNEVHSFLNINEISEESLLNILNNYPKEFNFELLAETKIIEKEKIIETKVVETRTKVIRNQIITCYTTDDAFLSAEVSTQLAVLYSKESNQKVLVMDFNNLNPCIDHFLAIDKTLKLHDKYDINSQTSLVSLVNAIDRQKLDYDLFKKLVIKHEKYNLDVLTGLYDILLDDKVDRTYYEKIIKMASEIYDVVIINTNPYIKAESTYVALLNATKVIGITNANLTNIRNLLETFKVLKSKIDREKIQIVFTNISANSVDNQDIKHIVGDYKILGSLKVDPNKEYALNNQKIYIEVANKKNKQEYYEIIKRLEYVPKTSRNIFKNILRRTSWGQ